MDIFNLTHIFKVPGLTPVQHNFQGGKPACHVKPGINLGTFPHKIIVVSLYMCYPSVAKVLEKMGLRWSYGSPQFCEGVITAQAGVPKFYYGKSQMLSRLFLGIKV